MRHSERPAELDAPKPWKTPVPGAPLAREVEDPVGIGDCASVEPLPARLRFDLSQVLFRVGDGVVAMKLIYFAAAAVHPSMITDWLVSPAGGGIARASMR